MRGAKSHIETKAGSGHEQEPREDRMRTGGACKAMARTTTSHQRDECSS